MSCKENKANLTDKRCLFLTGRAIIESKRVSKDGAASASGAPPISGSSALSAEPAARFSASMSRAVNFLVGWGAASDKQRGWHLSGETKKKKKKTRVERSFLRRIETFHDFREIVWVELNFEKFLERISIKIVQSSVNPFAISPQRRKCEGSRKIWKK